jgi:hypothetical protein
LWNALWLLFLAVGDGGTEMAAKKRLELDNGDVFEGRTAPGAESTPLSGTMTHKNGDKYRGTFLDGLRHGTGALTFANGDVYEGTFVRGHLVGKGMFRDVESATTFEGKFGTRCDPRELAAHATKMGPLDDDPFYAGLRSARGLVPPASVSASSPAGDAGAEEMGQTPQYAHAEYLSGDGRVRFGHAPGRIFEGQFARGIPMSAKGSLFLPVTFEGDDDADELLYDVYVGEMSPLSWPHGQGRLERHDGDVIVGTFWQGVAQGHMHMRNARGDTYEGDVVDGVRHGRGTWRLANGDEYDGQFRQGLQHGRGRSVSAAEGSFEGLYERGRRHGGGRLVTSTGVVFEGTWHCGARWGRGISYMPGGERQEAWYRNDCLHGTPRIFFNTPSRLPSLIASRTTGASLRSFCVRGHGLSPHLRPRPRPRPRHQHGWRRGPLHVARSHCPRTACPLTSGCCADARWQVSADRPIRLELRLLREDSEGGAASNSWATSAKLIVAPLMEWSSYMEVFASDLEALEGSDDPEWPLDWFRHRANVGARMIDLSGCFCACRLRLALLHVV